METFIVQKFIGKLLYSHLGQMDQIDHDLDHLDRSD